MSHPLAAPLLLSVVSIAHTQSCMPIAPAANDEVTEPKKSQMI
jgi:hypothetical protein